MAEEEQDFSKLPLEERCFHKNWKARVSAYEELTKIFQRIDDDKEWGKYGHWVRKFPVDSNAAAQEKGMEVTLVYLENAGLPQAGRIVGEIMGGLVSKGLTVTRAKSKELVMNIALMCVEVEKFETVQEELLKGMEQKNPKVVAGCIIILTEILKLFGPKVLTLKTLIKKIPVLTEDRDKTVRDETKKLMVELFRWLGPGLKPQMNAVKPMVLTDVEAELEKIAEKPKQTRYLRSQQVREERAGEADEVEAGDENEGESEAVAPDVDLYDLLEPVEILSKLPKDFYEKIEAKKWQERKEAMESLETLVSNPKLEAGDYGDLVRALKRIISKDSNVIVVALAGKNLASLASGLKKRFAPYAASSISTILEKFKEKKANVVTAMRDAIDAAFVATSYEAIQEDVLAALGNKNPSIKAETNAFLARSFAKTPLSIIADRKLMKPFFTAIVANINESDPTVREAAAEGLGVAMKQLGEKGMTPFIADMEPIKLQKVKEFMEKAVITAPKDKNAGKVAASKSAPALKTVSVSSNKTAVKKPVKKAVIIVPEDLSPQYEKPPAVAAPRIVRGSKSAPKVPIVGVRAGSGAKKGGAIPSSTKPVEEPIGSNLPVNNLKSQRLSDEMKLRILRWNFSQPREEFVDLLKELMAAAGIGQTLMTNMFNQNFKLHLKAIDTLQEEFNQNPDGTKANLDLIMKWATLRFFDTNPAVLIRILEYFVKVFEVLSQDNYSMSDVEATAFVPYLVVKLGEPKENVRISVHEIIRLITSVYQPQKMFTLIIDGIKSKNARQRTDCLDELSHMIGTHGIHVMVPSAPVALKEVAKQISDRDNNVRNAALNCFVEAYRHLGERVYKMIGQLLDKDQSLLEERIKRSGIKMQQQAPQPPPQQQRERPVASASASTKLPPPARFANGMPSTNNNNGSYPSSSVSSGSPQAETSPPPSTSHTVTPLLSSTSPRSNGAGGVLQPHNGNISPRLEEYYVPPPPNYGSALGSRDKQMSGLPAKYRIDFDAIDKMFSDTAPIPPLELMDTNVEQFLLKEEITIPKRRSTYTDIPALRQGTSSVPDLPPKVMTSIDSYVNNLGETNVRLATESSVNLEKLVTDLDVATIMVPRIDKIMRLLTKQFRCQQAVLGSASSEKLQELTDFFRASLSLISALFKTPTLPKRCTIHTIKESINQLLVLIIDESVEHLSDPVQIIRLINVLVVRIIENSDPSVISCALIRLLNDTLSNAPVSSRFLELVMKCQWKLLKQQNQWGSNEDYVFDMKAVLQEFQSFLQRHPVSSFEHCDETPLKTVKTIVHALIMKSGWERVQMALNELPELKHSEGGNYVVKIIAREQAKKRIGTTNLFNN